MQIILRVFFILIAFIYSHSSWKRVVLWTVSDKKMDTHSLLFDILLGTLLTFSFCSYPMLTKQADSQLLIKKNVKRNEFGMLQDTDTDLFHQMRYRF